MTALSLRTTVLAIMLPFATAAGGTELDPIQQLVTDSLLATSDTPVQESLARTIGIICPLGVLNSQGTDGQDLQARCNEIAGASLAGPAGDAQGARDGLQAMAPEEDAAIASLEVDASSGHVDSIGGRLANVRGATPGAVVQRTGSGFQWNSLAAGDDAASRWGFFVNGLYNLTDRDATLRESGFEADDYGVTVGADYAFSDTFVFGLAFGYRDSDADIDGNGGNLESDSLSVFGYWSFYSGDWYTDVMVGYTDSDHDQARNTIYAIGATTVNNSALSSTQSDEISASIAVGRNYGYNRWTLTPYGRFEFADTNIDGFSERMSAPGAAGSGFALAIDEQDVQSLTMTFGGTATTEVQTPGARLYPSLTVEYVHEFDNETDPITGRFVVDPTGTTFSLLADDADENFFNIGAGVTAVLTDRTAGFIRYQGLVGYDDLAVHAFEIGLRTRF